MFLLYLVGKLKISANEWQGQVEMGSKNHEVVPTPLIAQISGLRGASGVNKSISAIAKVGLIAKVKNAKCLFRCACCLRIADRHD